MSSASRWHARGLGAQKRAVTRRLVLYTRLRLFFTRRRRRPCPDSHNGNNRTRFRLFRPWQILVSTDGERARRIFIIIIITLTTSYVLYNTTRSLSRPSSRCTFTHCCVRVRTTRRTPTLVRTHARTRTPRTCNTVGPFTRAPRAPDPFSYGVPERKCDFV